MQTTTPAYSSTYLLSMTHVDAVAWHLAVRAVLRPHNLQVSGMAAATATARTRTRTRTTLDVHDQSGHSTRVPATVVEREALGFTANQVTGGGSG